MKIFSIISTVLFSLSLYAQQPAPSGKGATPLTPPPSEGAGGRLRAVVVGISDYQDDKIPDLRFADKDAEAFANFLRSPAGGSLTGSQLKLLVNQQATIGEVYKTLDWLVEMSQPGDRAIIYFSGHGDIEAKTLRQEGFLLCYNSPPNNYRTNAFAVYFLRDIVEQLSILKQAKVVLITDACRAGKLAGSNAGGSQATAAALQEQFANEIKILSCQPNEFSMEGEQWGGGRGAFSYHLVDGLYGMADRDNDALVKLKEIDRYLEDRVPAETDPQVQNPVVIGDKETLLATVDAGELAKIKAQKQQEPPAFSPGDMRGFEALVLEKTDTSIQKAYEAFLAAIGRGDLMTAAEGGQSANDYFEILINEPGTQQLHGFLKRTFVAALMDDAQEAINGWLRSDPRETASWSTQRGTDYYKFPLQLEKAAALLGEYHYLYKDLKAKEYFFRGWNQVDEMGGPIVKWDSVQLAINLHYIQEGLKYDSLAPYLHYSMAFYHGLLRKEPEHGIPHFQKAIALAPTWVHNLCFLSICYSDAGKFGKAREAALQAYQLDSTDLEVLDALKACYAGNHQFDEYKKMASRIIKTMESQRVYDDMIMLRAVIYWWNGDLPKAEAANKAYLDNELTGVESVIHLRIIAYFKLGWIKLFEGKLGEAETWFLKCDSLMKRSQSSAGLAFIAHKKGQLQLADELFDQAFHLDQFSDPLPVVGIGLFQIAMYGWLDETVLFFNKALKHFPENAGLHYHLGRIYLEQLNDFENGIAHLEAAVRLDENHAYAWYHLAAAHARMGNSAAALDCLEKALQAGFDDPEKVRTDLSFETLRKAGKYMELVGKYCPNQSNN